MGPVSQGALAVGDGLQVLGLALSPLLLLPFVLLVVPALAGNWLQGSRFITRTNSAGLTLSGWLLAIMAIVQVIAVLARYMFGLSFTWLNEIVLYCFAAGFLLAAAGALATNAHVRVDIIYGKLSPSGKAIVDLLGFYLLLLPLLILILQTYAPTLAVSWQILEGSSETDGLPIQYLFKSLVPVFAAMLLLQGWCEAIAAALTIRNATRLTLET